MGWSLIYFVESFYSTLPWSIREKKNLAIPYKHFYGDVLYYSDDLAYSKVLNWKIVAACLVQWIWIKATGFI
eukprot:Pgem_evm1s9584